MWLLPATADLLANLLAANKLPRSIFSYHSVTLVPIFAVAAIHGGYKLARTVRSIGPVRLSQYVLLFTLILGYAFAPLPLYGSANYWKADHFSIAHDPVISNIQNLISDGSVSAQGNVGSHFSQRTMIYFYPQKVGETDFVILQLKSPTQKLLPYEAGAVSTLANHIMMNTPDYLDSVSDLLADEQYGIVFWKDPWLVLQRGEVNVTNEAQVLDKIEFLRGRWLGSTSR